MTNDLHDLLARVEAAGPNEVATVDPMPLSAEGRAALLAAYGAIEACGGTHPEDDETSGFAEGFRVGLELALVQIDQMLNADSEPDQAWIEEGLQRLKSATQAQASPGPRKDGSALQIQTPNQEGEGS